MGYFIGLCDYCGETIESDVPPERLIEESPDGSIILRRQPHYICRDCIHKLLDEKRPKDKEE